MRAKNLFTISFTLTLTLAVILVLFPSNVNSAPTDMSVDGDGDASVTENDVVDVVDPTVVDQTEVSAIASNSTITNLAVTNSTTATQTTTQLTPAISTVTNNTSTSTGVSASAATLLSDSITPIMNNSTNGTAMASNTTAVNATLSGNATTLVGNYGSVNITDPVVVSAATPTSASPSTDYSSQNLPISGQLVPIIFGANCSKQCQRKEIHDATQAELDLFINTLLKIMDHKDSNGNSSWDSLANKHMSSGIHGNDFFFPSHSALIAEVEQLGQSYDPDFCLMYWATEYQWDSWPTSQVWKTVGSLKAGPLDGVFSGKTFQALGNHSIERQPNTTYKFCDSYKLQAISQKSKPSYSNFRVAYDNCHARVHLGVNGTMNTMLSILDPVFILHHANVDRHYHQWVAGSGSAFNGTVDTPCKGFESIPVKDAMNVTNMCASYVPPKKLQPDSHSPISLPDIDNSLLKNLGNSNPVATNYANQQTNQLVQINKNNPLPTNPFGITRTTVSSAVSTDPMSLNLYISVVISIFALLATII